MTTLDKMKALSPTRRKKVEARVAELIAEAISLSATAKDIVGFIRS
jgi:hypothetical protein